MALLCVGVVSVAAKSTFAFETPEAVVAAMDIDMNSVSGIVTPDTSPEMFDVRSSLGVVSPQNAPNMGLLFTGDVDEITNYTGNSPEGCHDYPGTGLDESAGDYVTLGFDIEVPSYANSFSFDFNFLSREYPEWVGSAFNDTFEVHLTSNVYQGQIVFDAFGNPVTVNNALFVIDSFNDPTQLPGTGFDQDGATGWVTTMAPCDPGEVMHLSFEIYDVSDGVWDSGVLLDNFQFNEEDVEDPKTDPEDPGPTEPMSIAFVSPKEGELEGGNTVLIHGHHFAPTEVYWGEVSIPFQLISSEVLSVEVPAADQPGSIDLRVENAVETYTLTAAYTYWEFGVGDVQPQIHIVLPDDASPTAGAKEIRVRGTRFDSGAQVYFVDIEGEVLGEEQLRTPDPVDVNGVLYDEIALLTPAHAEGWVDIVVVNGSGLRSEPGYPYFYSGDAQVVGTSVQQGDSGCSVAGSRSLAPGVALFLLAAGMLGLRRDRRRETASRVGTLIVGGAMLATVPLTTGCAENNIRALPNRAPLAVAAMFDGWAAESQRRLGYTVLEETAVLDGSRSRDPDNDAEELEYFWSFESIPEDSDLTDESIVVQEDDPETEMNESALVHVTPDVLGTYRINLVVRDRRGDDSLPAVVVVESVLPRDLRIELEWTNDNGARADLDLHLIKPGGDYFSEDGDCFSWYSNPNWGTDDLASDNPMLVDEDGEADEDGEPPFYEVLSLEMPEDTCGSTDCNYLIWVHYYSDHSAALGGADSAVPVSPTVTISVLGQVLAADVSPPQPLQEGDVWQVRELTWPDRELLGDGSSIGPHSDLSSVTYNEQG